MPTITIRARKGRNIEQKRGLVKDVTDAVVKNFNVRPEAIRIDIIEYSDENLADGGKLLIDR